MVDTIAAFFSDNLPTLPTTVAKEFASGMLAYLDAFKIHRDMAMNYEALPDYQNAQFTLMRVPTDQFWPYAPHFRKCVALALQALFKTKMVQLSASQSSMEQVLVFVDVCAHRWIVVVEGDPLDQGMNRLCLYFPRANTPVCSVSTENDAKIYAGTMLLGRGISLAATDIRHWTCT